TGDMGELDDDGFLRVTGRKKELIVTAGGKNVAPAVLEDRIRAHPLVSQVLVVGDGRPYVAALITLDEESVEIWKAKFPRLQDATTAELTEAPELLAELQGTVDEANKAVSRAEAVRRYRVLPGDFTEQGGHLTPSLKVRRNVVMKDFADEIEALSSWPSGVGRPAMSGGRWPRGQSPARISAKRRAMISQRHSWCTQAMPFSPIALAAQGSVSNRFS